MLAEKNFNSVFGKVSLSDNIQRVFSTAQVTSFKIYKKEKQRRLISLLHK